MTASVATCAQCSLMRQRWKDRQALNTSPAPTQGGQAWLQAASPDWSVFQAQLLCVGRHLDAEKNQDSLSPAADEGTSLHLAFRHPSEVQTLVPGQVQEDKVPTGLTVWRFLPITGDQSCFLQTDAAAAEPRPPGSHVIAVVLQQIPPRPPAQLARGGVVPESLAVWRKEVWR